MQELTGLVVCGGLSSRMGRDKSLVEWHGIAQRYFLYRMTEPLCGSVFISCNAAQAPEIAPDYNYIVDDENYANAGPIAALLTAFDKFPNNSFLVIGGDYPFLKNEDLVHLVSNRNENDVAVSFFDEATGFYEPLIAVYENKIADLLFDNFWQQQFSLQKILAQSSACKVDPIEMKAILSINTQEEYLKAVEEMKKVQ